MRRCDRFGNSSYVCIFKRFRDSTNFVYALKEAAPDMKVFLRGLYVKIIPDRGREIQTMFEKYF